jgi:hypothetical protein
MGPELTQVGVAGILIMLVVKELFAFLKTRNGNGNAHKAPEAGSQSVEFWKAEFKAIAESAMATQLAQIGDAARDLQHTQHKVHEGVVELVVLARQMSQRTGP